MNSQVSTKINEKQLNMVFNMRMLTRLGRFLKLQTLEEVTSELNKLSTLDSGASLEAIELLWAVIYHAVVCVPGQEESITMLEVESLALADLTVIARDMSAGLVESFPQHVPGDDDQEEVADEQPAEEKKS